MTLSKREAKTREPIGASSGKFLINSTLNLTIFIFSDISDDLASDKGSGADDGEFNGQILLSEDEKNYAQFGKSKQQFKLMEIPFPSNMVKA